MTVGFKKLERTFFDCSQEETTRQRDAKTCGGLETGRGRFRGSRGRKK
jgi:hypothetical protein